MQTRQKAHAEYLNAIQASPGITTLELRQRFPETNWPLPSFLHEAQGLRMIRKEVSDDGKVTRYYPTR